MLYVAVTKLLRKLSNKSYYLCHKVYVLYAPEWRPSVAVRITSSRYTCISLSSSLILSLKSFKIASSVIVWRKRSRSSLIKYYWGIMQNKDIYSFVKYITKCDQDLAHVSEYIFNQWRYQPDFWSCNCKYFCVQRP